MTPISKSLSWLRCCQTPLGRGFETYVDVRVELGDVLCNLVVLSTSGKRLTDLIHHRLGTPYR